MRDPWESDAPTQKLQSELTRMMIKQEDLPDAPKQPAVKLKQQSLARNEKDPVASRIQQLPKKATPTPQIVPNPTMMENLLQLNRENLIQGVIWAEILGKPKANKGRR